MLMGQCINLTTIGVFQYISPLTEHADDNFVVLQYLLEYKTIKVL